MLLLRSIFFTLLMPGSVTVLIPWWLLSTERFTPNVSVFRYFGLPLLLGGACVLLWSIWQFYAEGRGTLAPVDAPKILVIKGLYRYVRNPMYVGVAAILLGEAIFFGSFAVLCEAGIFILITHLFITFYEERVLLAQFGESYRSYQQSVNRWLPRAPKSQS